MFAMYSGSFDEGIVAIIKLKPKSNANVRLSAFYYLYYAKSLIYFWAMMSIVFSFFIVSRRSKAPSDSSQNLVLLLIPWRKFVYFRVLWAFLLTPPTENPNLLYVAMPTFSKPIPDRSLLELILISSTLRLVSLYKISLTRI